MNVNNPETILCTFHLTTQASMISFILIYYLRFDNLSGHLSYSFLKKKVPNILLFLLYKPSGAHLSTINFI